MNQMPNIEETVEDFIARFSVNIADVKTTKELAKYWIRKTLLDLQETHHQQLQKARHDWLREEIVKLEIEQRKHNCPPDDGNNYDHGAYVACQTIIDRYQSELDQPNK